MTADKCNKGECAAKENLWLFFCPHCGRTICGRCGRLRDLVAQSMEGGTNRQLQKDNSRLREHLRVFDHAGVDEAESAIFFKIAL